MTRLPEFKYKALTKKLNKAGYFLKRSSSGSHEVWFNPENKKTSIIPKHNKPLPKGLLRDIIRQMGLTVKEFLDL